MGNFLVQKPGGKGVPPGAIWYFRGVSGLYEQCFFFKERLEGVIPV
jgi:hypothetical protein